MHPFPVITLSSGVESIIFPFCENEFRQFAVVGS